MATLTINNTFVFTAETRAKIPNVQVKFPGLPISLFFTQGDLVTFDDFGQFTFVVRAREFHLRSEAQIDVTYLLELPDDANPPSRLRLVDSAPKQGG